MSAPLLSRFTPSLIGPESLEMLLVQRARMAARCMELIHDSAMSPAKHHQLFIGPRGIGKTHLVSVVYHRAQSSAKLRDRIMIAWLHEEEWGVSSFLDFVQRVLAALANDDRYDHRFDEKMAALGDGRDAEDVALNLLLEILAGRTLILIAENLQDLFAALGRDGQLRLRAFLQQHPVVALVTTAQSLFNGVRLQTSPFYGFFHVVHLEPLDLAGTVELLARIAKLKGDTELAEFVETHQGRARVRAIHHLAGGSHRVYVFLSELLTKESLDELSGALLHVIDELTPYYQSKMQLLPVQQRKLVHALCEQGGATTVTDIAKRCRISPQTASGQLRRLRELGYVRSVAHGRESFYEIAEPLMRLSLSVKASRGRPVELLVDFLRLWYSRPELEERLNSTHEKSIEHYLLTSALRRAEQEAADPRVAACEEDLSHFVAGEDYAGALGVAEELVAIRGSALDYGLAGMFAMNTDAHAKAESYLCQARKLDAEIDSQLPGVTLAHAYVLEGLGRIEEARDACSQAADREHSAEVPLLRGHLQSRLGMLENALVDFRAARTEKPNLVAAWRGEAEILMKLERWTEAIEAYGGVVGGQSLEGLALIGRVGAAVKTGQWEQAEADLSRISALQPGDVEVRLRLELMLGVVREAQGRHEEALASVSNYIQGAPKDGKAWAFLAVIALKLRRYAEAADALDQAVGLGFDDAKVAGLRMWALAGSRRWDECSTALRTVLHVNAVEPPATLLSLLIVVLANASLPEPELRRRLAAVIQVCSQVPSGLMALGAGLAGTIRPLTRGMARDAIETWRLAWIDESRGISELGIATRMLDVAARFAQSADPRVLLELPIEQRTIVEQALTGDEPAQVATKPEVSGPTTVGA
jgi:tetratricopeptide (TPR) repeat protein